MMVHWNESVTRMAKEKKNLETIVKKSIILFGDSWFLFSSTKFDLVTSWFDYIVHPGALHLHGDDYFRFALYT